MRVSPQRWSTAHESRDAEGRDPDLERGQQVVCIRSQARSILPHWRRRRIRERENNALPEAQVACQFRAALTKRRLSRAMCAQRRDSAVPALRPWSEADQTASEVDQPLESEADCNKAHADHSESLDTLKRRGCVERRGT